MEWTRILTETVAYLEEHIREDVSLEDAAQAVHVSPLYLQRGFEIVTGCTVARYLRCRRLYLAALDLAAGDARVLDVALRYGFETPESFSKAFSRFHGATPTQVKRDHSRIKPFFPLKISLSVEGGETVEYAVEQMGAFQMVGFAWEIPYDGGYRECPRLWNAFLAEYLAPLTAGKAPETPEEKAVCRYRIGEFAVCVDEGEEGEASKAFRYLIAGRYGGGPVPEGMKVYGFPAMEWAKFPCRGPMPGALQAVNTQIFREWLPSSPEHEIAMGANIEWYSSGNTESADYESAIWIPVRRRGSAD